jgi:hypothetical protein
LLKGDTSVSLALANNQGVAFKTKTKLKSEFDPPTKEAASTQEQNTEVATTKRERGECECKSIAKYKG